MLKIEGLAELSAKLLEIADPGKANREFRSAVRTATNPILRAARANISAISPGKRAVHKLYTGRYVASGFSAANVRMKIIQSRDKTMIAGLVGPSRPAFYASQFFELGTSRLPKQEWLTPALESQKGQAVQLIAKALRGRLNRIARKRAKAAL